MVLRRILVINPNSSLSATKSIEASIAPLRLEGGPEIHVTRLEDGPSAIVKQADVESVVAPLAALVAREDASAFVLACFSDPGLSVVREAAGGRPVMGIGECGILHAMTLGRRFGIIALSDPSVIRQRRMIVEIGVSERYAGSIPVEAAPAEVMAGGAFTHLLTAAKRLRDEQGADVLVLGCAGMAEQRRSLAEASGLPVVEPTRQATVAALGAACLQGL